MRSEGRRKDWKHIRSVILNRAKGRCQICGHYQEKGMICHEKWKYDKKKLIATLVDFKIVCPMCNNVLHFGRTMAVIYEKKPEILDEVLSHVSGVNDVTPDKASQILDCMWEWIKIADEDWQIEIALRLVSRFPDLANLEL